MIENQIQTSQSTRQEGFDLQSFLDVLPDAAVVLTEDGSIQFWNAAAQGLLSRNGSHPSGKLFPFSKKLGEALQVEVLDRKNVHHYLELKSSPLDLNGNKVYLVLLRDVTAVNVLDTGREILVDFVDTLQQNLSKNQIFNLVVDKLDQALHVESIALIQRASCDENYIVQQGRGIPAEWIGSIVSLDKNTQNFIQSKTAFLSNNILKETALPFPEFISGARSAAIFPLEIDEDSNGAVILASSSGLLTEEYQLAERIVRFGVSALQRAVRDQRAEQSVQRLTALRILNLAVSGSLELEKTLNVLLDQITSQLHVDAADIYLFNPNTHLLIHTARSGFWTNPSGFTYLKISEGMPGRVIQERKLIYVQDIKDRETDFIRYKIFSLERFLSYFAVPLISKGQIKGVLELFSRHPVQRDAQWSHFLESLAAEAAVAIENAEMVNELHASNEELMQAYDATIMGWSRTLELRDHETKGHCDRVVDMTLHLAKRLGVPESELVHIRRGAMLHDIGKTGIPDSILLKCGPLDDDEIDIMRRHPEYAVQLLSGIPFLQPALDIPYCHHEKWDGTGYPRGLKGEDIPFAARIFAIVDVYDALSYARPYREAWSQERVLEYIHGQNEKQFDPQVFHAFMKLIQEDAAHH